MNLTELTLKNLSPGTYMDDTTPGFGIRVGLRRKTWIVVKGRGRVKTAIGHWPALTLSDARRRAKMALLAPSGSRSAPPFPEALEAFLAQDRWKPRSKVVLVSSLKHFTWTRPLDKITHEDVAQALEAIPHKSARAHALKDIRTFFNWCVPRYLTSSPAQGLKMPTYKPRERVLTDDELRRVWIATETLTTFDRIVRLLILTGARRGEIASLTWEDIKSDQIHLRETKNGRDHFLPKGQLCASTIGTAFSKSGIVFSASGKPSLQYNGWGKHLKALQSKSGTANWTLHDLRRTFATNLAALGTPIHVTEKLLNHVSGTTGGIVSVYQKHAYWDEQVAALQKWENRLLSFVR